MQHEYRCPNGHVQQVEEGVGALQANRPCPQCQEMGQQMVPDLTTPMPTEIPTQPTHPDIFRPQGEK